MRLKWVLQWFIIIMRLSVFFCFYLAYCGLLMWGMIVIAVIHTCRGVSLWWISLKFLCLAGKGGQQFQDYSKLVYHLLQPSTEKNTPYKLVVQPSSCSVMMFKINGKMDHAWCIPSHKTLSGGREGAMHIMHPSFCDYRAVITDFLQSL